MSPVLCFAPRHDSVGKHDATGAFQPESLRFAARHGGSVTLFDNRANYPARARVILNKLGRAEPGMEPVVAFFGHGGKRWLQHGFRDKVFPRNVEVLADALARLVLPGGKLRVILYACLAGAEGGIASTLTKALGARDVDFQVFAHTTAGHTTRNPYVVRFDNEHLGGEWLVAPGAGGWDRWKQDLRSDTPLRLDLPYLLPGR